MNEGSPSQGARVQMLLQSKSRDHSCLLPIIFGHSGVQRLSYLERAGKNNVDLKFSPMLPTKSADQQSKTGVTQRYESREKWSCTESRWSSEDLFLSASCETSFENMVWITLNIMPLASLKGKKYGGWYQLNLISVTQKSLFPPFLCLHSFRCCSFVFSCSNGEQYTNSLSKVSKSEGKHLDLSLWYTTRSVD